MMAAVAQQDIRKRCVKCMAFKALQVRRKKQVLDIGFTLRELIATTVQLLELLTVSFLCCV